MTQPAINNRIAQYERREARESFERAYARAIRKPKTDRKRSKR